jgi:hypothetical protein
MEKKSIQKNGIGPRMFIASPPVYSESGLTGNYRWTRQSINYSTKLMLKRDKGDKGTKVMMQLKCTVLSI